MPCFKHNIILTCYPYNIIASLPPRMRKIKNPGEPGPRSHMIISGVRVERR